MQQYPHTVQINPFAPCNANNRSWIQSKIVYSDTFQICNNLPSDPLFRKPIIIIYLYYIENFQKAKPNTLRIELNIWTQCLCILNMDMESPKS